MSEEVDLENCRIELSMYIQEDDHPEGVTFRDVLRAYEAMQYMFDENPTRLKVSQEMYDNYIADMEDELSKLGLKVEIVDWT